MKIMEVALVYAVFTVKSAAGISNYKWQGLGVIHFERPSREFAPVPAEFGLMAVTKRERRRGMGRNIFLLIDSLINILCKTFDLGKPSELCLIPRFILSLHFDYHYLVN
jgi:hypothetical protein